MWAGSGAGRVLISRNVNAAAAARHVHADRRHAPAGPCGVVDLRRPDEREPRDRHVLRLQRDDSRRRRATCSTWSSTRSRTPPTWTDISFDIGDQPVNDAVLDTATGDIYVSTDYTVLRLVAGTQTWVPAADGLPVATVSGLTLAAAKQSGDRLLYAATHGRSAYRLRLK